MRYYNDDVVKLDLTNKSKRPKGYVESRAQPGAQWCSTHLSSILYGSMVAIAGQHPRRVNKVTRTTERKLLREHQYRHYE